MIITSCTSTPKESVIKTQVLQKIPKDDFIGVTEIGTISVINNYKKSFIVAAPDHKKYSDFSTYFQLGILAAKEKYRIENEVSFVSQENLDLEKANQNFLIGPISSVLVNKIDGLLLTNRALLLNDSIENFSISLSEKSQNKALSEYLSNEGINRIGFIEDESIEKDRKSFKNVWFNDDKDAITIEVGENPTERIENFLDVSESKDRYNLIDEASFSQVEFVPRSRKDFKQIVIFPKDLNRLYEIASLVRFNYGLDYEIFSFTSDFTQKIDSNEISLHGISLIDHTYKNKYGYDLTKSRSFCLGFDAMLISFAVANEVKGEIRGLLGIYEIDSQKLTSKSYIN